MHSLGILVFVRAALRSFTRMTSRELDAPSLCRVIRELIDRVSEITVGDYGYRDFNIHSLPLDNLYLVVKRHLMPDGDDVFRSALSLLTEREKNCVIKALTWVYGDDEETLLKAIACGMKIARAEMGMLGCKKKDVLFWRKLVAAGVDCRAAVVGMLQDENLIPLDFLRQTYGDLEYLGWGWQIVISHGRFESMDYILKHALAGRETFEKELLDLIDFSKELVEGWKRYCEERDIVPEGLDNYPDECPRRRSSGAHAAVLKWRKACREVAVKPAKN